MQITAKSLMSFFQGIVTALKVVVALLLIISVCAFAGIGKLIAYLVGGSVSYLSALGMSLVVHAVIIGVYWIIIEWQLARERRVACDRIYNRVS
jgi:hypothetical protein